MDTHTLKNLIKFISFLGLAIASYIELYYYDMTLYENPFILGALAMAFATFLEYYYHSISYTYVVMYFFIFTKLVTQNTYSKYYTLTGIKKNNKNINSEVTKNHNKKH